ncbi:hypothetical protein EJB05_37536, partial [Eragrostis curvula]
MATNGMQIFSCIVDTLLGQPFNISHLKLNHKETIWTDIAHTSNMDRYGPHQQGSSLCAQQMWQMIARGNAQGSQVVFQPDSRRCLHSRLLSCPSDSSHPANLLEATSDNFLSSPTPIPFPSLPSAPTSRASSLQSTANAAATPASMASPHPSSPRPPQASIPTSATGPPCATSISPHQARVDSSTTPLSKRRQLSALPPDADDQPNICFYGSSEGNGRHLSDCLDDDGNDCLLRNDDDCLVEDGDNLLHNFLNAI